jgi:hypothetical protein
VRILGAASGVPLTELRRLRGVLWFGFWLNAASGVLLLIGYPTKAFTNPLFYVKLALVVAGVIVQRRIERRVLGDASLDLAAVPAAGRVLAAVSLACWAGAIVSGRLLAYTYSVLTSV